MWPLESWQICSKNQLLCKRPGLHLHARCSHGLHSLVCREVRGCWEQQESRRFYLT